MLEDYFNFPYAFHWYLFSGNKVCLLIAHEITHAFDDVGIQYDSQGSYKPLYDNETVSRFHNASGKHILFFIAF